MLSRSSTGREHDKKCLVGSKTTCRTTAVAFECSYEIYALCIRPQDQDSHDGCNDGLEGVSPRDKIDDKICTLPYCENCHCSRLYIELYTLRRSGWILRPTAWLVHRTDTQQCHRWWAHHRWPVREHTHIWCVQRQRSWWSTWRYCRLHNRRSAQRYHRPM